ncbi:MAG: addiction module protein [Planctomycetia bacterium]|nr:addiction module protein [Planctomycetia bacterium]
MSDFNSVLSAAQQLPEQDRLRLIDALWDTVPPESDAPFSDEWASEIERRISQLDAGEAKSVPWTQIRDAALARIGHGKS